MYIRRHVAFDVMTSSFISKIKEEKPPLNAARIHALCFDTSSCSNYLFSLSLSLGKPAGLPLQTMASKGFPSSHK